MLLDLRFEGVAWSVRKHQSHDCRLLSRVGGVMVKLKHGWCAPLITPLSYDAASRHPGIESSEMLQCRPSVQTSGIRDVDIMRRKSPWSAAAGAVIVLVPGVVQRYENGAVGVGVVAGVRWHQSHIQQLPESMRLPLCTGKARL